MHQISTCSEASKTSGNKVSHFYKFEDSHCTCVFCGKQISSHQNSINTLTPPNFDPNIQTSIVGLRG